MPLNKAREKDRDRDVEPSKAKDRDRPRHKSSRSSRKVDKASTPPGRSSGAASPTNPPKQRRSSLPVPELERKSSKSSSSPHGSKTSLPYPSFSKAHSKEAVGSREQVVNPRLSYYTPDATDISKEKDGGVEEGLEKRRSVAPPSPPETTLDQNIKTETADVDTMRVERKRTDLQKAADDLKRKLGRESADEMRRRKNRESAKTSEVGKERHSHSSRSRRDSVKESAKEGSRSVSSPKNSKPSTPSKLRSQPKVATVEDSASTISVRKTSSPEPRSTAAKVDDTLSSTSFRKASSSVQSTGNKSDAPTIATDSDATSIAPNQPNTQRPFTPVANRDSSPATDSGSPEPRTPTQSEAHPPPSRKETPAYSITGSYAPSAMIDESPMPPPPPPAPSEIPAPKVDYLIQNGGLPQAVPRSLLAAGQPVNPLLPPPTMDVQVQSFFSPFNKVLDDYTKVINKSGSLAVATGYRSVARRLLDRLEQVFARDLSAETCLCELCQRTSETQQELDDKRGVSWGEILEYVCGRQDLPQWPPFALENDGLGISGAEQAPPMQKLDVDVPEEFRDHYVRQSKKTKQSVDRWLASQPVEPSSPPQDVDDETLTFAMLTRLDPDQRPLFSTLLGVAPSRSASTAPIPRPTSTGPPRPASVASARLSSSILPPTSTLLQRTSLALQRLYRLSTPPRDPESAMYLLNNPPLHNVLATLAAVSDGEWEILTSGRFDGFLRSGADETTPTPSLPASTFPSRGPSRTNNKNNPTTTSSFPFRTPSFTSIAPSRGITPFSPSPTASAGAPVALDEETEIAVLATIEREIYLGMEALEDAFEALHLKAEAVRRSLRERGAGLSQASQKRNGLFGGGDTGGARMATPASAFDGESDGGGDDDGESVWSLAPDDSASNVSRSRMRRPKRRTERRTPAPVEEEDEDDGNDDAGGGGDIIKVVLEERTKGMGSKVGSKVGKWFGQV